MKKIGKSVLKRKRGPMKEEYIKARFLWRKFGDDLVTIFQCPPKSRNIQQNRISIDVVGKHLAVYLKAGREPVYKKYFSSREKALKFAEMIVNSNLDEKGLREVLKAFQKLEL